MAKKKMRRWNVLFEENGSEYGGSLKVTAKELHRDEENEKAFWADGVFVEIDERIIIVEEIALDTEKEWM